MIKVSFELISLLISIPPLTGVRGHLPMENFLMFPLGGSSIPHHRLCQQPTICILCLGCCATPAGFPHVPIFSPFKGQVATISVALVFSPLFQTQKVLFPGDRASLLAQEALSSNLLVSHIGRKFDDNSVKATLIFRDFFFLGKLPP